MLKSNFADIILGSKNLFPVLFPVEHYILYSSQLNITTLLHYGQVSASKEQSMYTHYEICKM